MMIVRAAVHLLVVISLTAWGFLAWPLPWPGILTGVGALIFSVLVWALFLSPKAVLAVDRFGRSLIELLFLGAAVAALLSIGVSWPVPVALFVVGAAVGFLADRSAAR